MTRDRNIMKTITLTEADVSLAWPSCPKVVKSPGVVLVVGIVIPVVVTAINYGLQELLTLITNIKGIGE